MTDRVLVIALDGYEISIADSLIAAGELAALAKLRSQSARFLLDHGSAKLTGLGAEHFSSGLSPEDGKRWSAIHFNPKTYEIWQEGAQFKPFPGSLTAKTVAFDCPYFDLTRVPKVSGISAWGAHDPGTEFSTNPDDLADEFIARFGPYPAQEWIYGFAWPSPHKCQVMGNALAHAVDLRSKAARWVLEEGCPDWELAVIGVSEAHSVVEALWHGVDDKHPLHGIPSSVAAAKGVKDVYRAIDRLIDELASAFPDVTTVVFSMHGMGRNTADVPSMVLLPEAMHRYCFERPFFDQPVAWSTAHDGIPILAESDQWQFESVQKRPLFQRLGELARTASAPAAESPRRQSMAWMPTMRIAPHWSQMKAFALPAFYDGQVRINLAGRESKGLVDACDYQAVCEDIRAMLVESRNPFDGERVVDYVKLSAHSDPRDLGPSEADLIVVWKGTTQAMEHDRFGRIGPVPFRRTGGHTGEHGMLYVHGKDIDPRDHGLRSSFDVVPTVIELTGQTVPAWISGVSLGELLRSVDAVAPI